MLKLNKAPDIFRLLGLVLLCIQLFSFVFSLRPFQSGTWFNTEPAMVALFGFGVFSSLWLGVGISKKWLVLELPVHPLIYVLSAWAFWQVALLPFAENNFRSLLGIPQTGEGVVWQVLLVVLTLFSMPLWSEVSNRKIILGSALLSMCIMAYLHFDPAVFCLKLQNYVKNNPVTPANWPDYLSFIAVYTWIIFASAQSLHTKRIYLLVLTLCAATILFSSNRIGNYFLPVVFIGMGIALFCRVWKGKPKVVSYLVKLEKLQKIVAVIGIFVPLYFVFVSQYPEKFPCKNDSLESRAVFNQVVVAKLSSEPLILVTGQGWGGFADDMFKYGMVDGLYSFRNGEYRPNCMWLAGTVFHSHDQPMEAILSSGLIGFILFMAIPIVAFLPLRRSLFWWCVPALIGISAVSVTWFTLPQVLPFQALAYAALCAGRRVTLRRQYEFNSYFSILSVVLAVFFALCLWQQVQMINYGERLKSIMSEDPNKEELVEFMAKDIARGGERLINVINYYMEFVLGKIASGTVTESDRDWYRNFLVLASNAATAPDASIKIIKLDVELSMLPFRVVRDSLIDDLKPEIKKTLFDSILRISKAAPQREDFTAPYFMSLEGVTGGDISKQIYILEQILSVAPNHRIALWLLGGILVQAKDENTREKGVEMQKKAIELGVERVYPVIK